MLDAGGGCVGAGGRVVVVEVWWAGDWSFSNFATSWSCWRCAYSESSGRDMFVVGWGLVVGGVKVLAKLDGGAQGEC